MAAAPIARSHHDPLCLNSVAHIATITSKITTSPRYLSTIHPPASHNSPRYPLQPIPHMVRYPRAGQPPTNLRLVIASLGREHTLRPMQRVKAFSEACRCHGLALSISDDRDRARRPFRLARRAIGEPACTAGFDASTGHSLTLHVAHNTPSLSRMAGVDCIESGMLCTDHVHVPLSGQNRLLALIQ